MGLTPLIEFLCPGLLQAGESHCPPWPPDAFAITATLLQRSGSYVHLLDGGGKVLQADWIETCQRVAKGWRKALNDHMGLGVPGLDAAEARGRGFWSSFLVPVEVSEWWQTLVASQDLAGFSGRQTSPEGVGLCRALLQLCLTADEASQGMGLQGTDSVDLLAALCASSAWANLCLWIEPDKARVLPKQHTPQRGLTIRSLSHHLALSPSEVAVKWHAPISVAPNVDLDVTNLLLLPWPFEVSVKSFELRTEPALPDAFRLFGYNRSSRPDQLERALQVAIEEARQRVSKIDGIVFPELALTEAEYKVAEAFALEQKALLIAGVDESDSAGGPGINTCRLQPAGLTPGASAASLDALRIRQRKHHRWCLDRRQILQYGLGGVLPASKDCWEATTLGSREINFCTYASWLTIAVLICEDLARQDPMAEVVRAVGPNLVIALLMDGPQLRSRWSARYASVLADDPGCSVLALTSLGMSRLSRPRPGETDRSRVIGLWRDIQEGDLEIELTEGCKAGVLSLVCEDAREYTADGRGHPAKFPVFAGFHELPIKEVNEGPLDGKKGKTC